MSGETRAETRTVPRGWGHALPKRRVSNEELSKTLDTSDEWIRQRTGIRERRVAGDDETTSTLARDAARMALANAGWTADTVDLFVVVTATPDLTFPSVACLVQAELDNHGAAAFDLAAACSGFVYGLSVVDALLRGGGHRRALLMGAEVFSRILDWNDRRTAVLFGDGAGAVALEAAGPGDGDGDGAGDDDEARRGIISTHLFADGSHSEALRTTGGVVCGAAPGVVTMEGREVYRHAVVRMAEAVEAALAANGMGSDDVDWFIPHQANLRLMETMAERLGIVRERMLVSVDRHANTSAASIPLLVSEESAAGRFRRGDLLLLEALGAGFTWGSALLRW
ncbi:MAG: ketoacyl-ACP synthase III [Alphaproteobacteria bacterium]|nr:ketoacyl-ACP synthase III [Alphaproteobacteria bacterium]MDA8004428.1 ketoacyl-ACP synthase III [Alphaproteobacteria bacterium]MDA8006343.1 ketoacyl-ACP synthase III [Alphaproteobacteria bacterium]MDA8013706.1 ketoacyl-ACP synthase III [Alphaproteobacteria bacterium]